MKALDGMGEEEQDIETVSSILNTIVDQAVANDDEEENNDEIGLAARIAKRSITSTMNVENDAHQMKRLRSGPAATAMVSV